MHYSDVDLVEEVAVAVAVKLIKVKIEEPLEVEVGVVQDPLLDKVELAVQYPVVLVIVQVLLMQVEVLVVMVH